MRLSLPARTGRILHDLLYPADLPGYRELRWHERVSVNTQALLMFVTSGTALRMVLYAIVWVLAAQIAVWHGDWTPVAPRWPAASALLWLLPWLARARRRCIAQIMGPWWSAE